jgi:peroxiredoxin
MKAEKSCLRRGVSMRRIILLFVIVVVFLAGSASMVIPQFFEAGVQKLEVPLIAPNFTLKKLGGGTISLGDLRGKVVLLNFFSPWCRTCQKAASSFDKLNKENKEKDIVILQVGVEAEEKDLIRFENDFHISSPILIDENGTVAKAYGVWGHHETFFIDRKGKIVGKAFEIENWESASMRKLFEHLLAQTK